MAIRIPTVPAVMLAMMGVFELIAAMAAFIPSFVHDRVPVQFAPVWRFLTGPIYSDEPNESVIAVLAVGSQIIIGLSEAIIGVALLGAAFIPKRRMVLANFGLGYSLGLFGIFMLTMFAMHDKALPAWHQYPAILGWIGVTWLVVSLTEQRATMTALPVPQTNRPAPP